MQRNLIIALIGIIFIVVFALQNSEPIKVFVFFRSFEISGSLLLTLTFFAGALLGVGFSLPSILKLKKKIAMLQEEKPSEETIPEEPLLP